MKKNRDTTLNIRLTKEEHYNLKKEAVERNLPMVGIVRQAVELYLRTYSNPKQDGK